MAANTYHNAAFGRAASPFDAAPVQPVVSAATADRNAIRAALHRLGVDGETAQTVMNAIVTGKIPSVNYVGN